MRSLSLLIGLLVVVATSQSTGYNEISLEVFVGQYLQFPIPIDLLPVEDKEEIPDWLIIQDCIMFGIPKPQDIGFTDFSIEMHNKTKIFFHVVVMIEQINPCKNNITSWLETYWSWDVTLYNMLTAFRMIKSLDLELDGNDTVRVYPIEFGLWNRVLENIEQEQFQGKFIVVWRASCWDFEDAVDAMDEYLSLEKPPTLKLKLARGFFKPIPTRIEPTTTVPMTTSTPVRIISTTPEVRRTIEMKKAPKTKNNSPKTTTSQTTTSRTNVAATSFQMALLMIFLIF